MIPNHNHLHFREIVLNASRTSSDWFESLMSQEDVTVVFKVSNKPSTQRKVFESSNKAGSHNQDYLTPNSKPSLPKTSEKNTSFQHAAWNEGDTRVPGLVGFYHTTVIFKKLQ